MSFHCCINKFHDTSIASVFQVTQVSLAHCFSALTGRFHWQLFKLHFAVMKN